MLTLVAIAVAVDTVAATIALIRGRVWVVNGVDSPMPIDRLSQITAADADSWRVITVLGSPGADAGLSALPGLALGCATAVAAVLVAQVLREVAHGRSFGVEARLGLGRLSLVLIVGGVASAALDLVAVLNLHAAISPLRDGWVREWQGEAPWVGVAATPSIPVLIVVLGVIVAALMFALTDGAALEREAEGVI